MKYLSIDIETTCVNPKKPENILQISMIVEDPTNPLPLEKLPHFTCFIKHDRVEGEPYAMGMNGWIMDIISGRAEGKHPIYKAKDWEEIALAFIRHHFGDSTRIVAAGKNFAGFDQQFLPARLASKLDFRCIDPTSVFWNPYADKMPSLTFIKKELGIEGEVTHDAYDDALDVIKVLRTKYGKS